MKWLKKETDQLKLQLEKNSRMFHLEVGLAPNTVLSALSGSLSSHTLTFLVIFLLIHTCGADPSGSLISFTPAAFYSVLAFVFVVVVAFCILFACYIQRCKGSESDMERGLLEDPSTSTLEYGTGDLERKTSVIDTLKEQKKLLENQKDQLKSQLEEVERKMMENKEKLLSVENKITEAERENKDKGGLLKEKENLTDVKWKLEEQKTSLEKLKLNVEQLQQIIDALAGGDRVQ
ncbi:uncharacterized protein [Thunnus thynnus]|uniref:uncharacterized protein n=1 Tax=Thunnus thynnus TaxID=8237 RepID=UPI0035279149